MKEVIQKKNLRCGVIIFLCFLWTSSGYLSWLYRLTEYTTASSADWLSEGIGYLIQSAGLLFFFLIMKFRRPQKTKLYFIAAILLDFFFLVLSVVAGNLALCLLFGYLMNFFHGIVAGFYLQELAQQVDRKHVAFTFGISYGLASIGSWLISLIGDNNFLRTKYVLIIYVFLVIFTIWAVLSDSEATPMEDITFSNQPISTRIILIAALVVLLFSAVRGIGFYFPMADISSGISLEFSRAFYAIGLILAGLISDYSRRSGAISCMIALTFPFAMIALSSEVEASIIFWILGYLFYGFLTVYRVVVFSDISRSKEAFLYTAGFGLLFGRIGDAIGSLSGMALQNNKILLVLFASAGFAITIVLFFLLYHRLYLPTPKKELGQDERLALFSEKYQFSARELDVFCLLMEGLSNGEISARLFISESTVKFHIRNMLKKTECKNRVGLISLFKNI